MSDTRDREQTFFTVIRPGKSNVSLYAAGRGQVAAKFFPRSDGMPSTFATDDFMAAKYYGMEGEHLGTIEYTY